MIPLWLLTKLPFLAKISPAVAKSGIKIALIAVAAFFLFVGGCQYANVKNDAEWIDYEREKATAIAERVKELNAEWNIRLHEEETARAILQGDLNVIRQHRDSLIEGIRNAQLTKPIEDVNIEACLETDDENVKLVIANPFSADFVSLWNDASRGVGGPGETAGPETD